MNHRYAHAHWWSKIHYGFMKKIARTFAIHLSIVTIMDASMANLTVHWLVGADLL